MADDIVKVKIDTDTSDSIKSVVKYTAAIGGATIAIKKAIDIGADLINTYKVQEQAERKLAGVVKATGGAAGLTTQEMITYAQSLQKVTTFGDEVIINAEAILGTFKNVKEDAFLRTTEAALDLSTVMGTDLNSAMLQLGKAVNDPILGVTALNRAGIQFTETQKDTIKALQESGDLYAAQDIVLKEVEAQMGGTARAMVGGTGAITQMNNVIGDLKEELGESVVEGLQPFAKWVTASTNAMIEFIQRAKIREVSEDITDLEVRIKKLQEGSIAARNTDSITGMKREDIQADEKTIANLQADLAALRKTRDEMTGGKIDEIIPPSIIDLQNEFNATKERELELFDHRRIAIGEEAKIRQDALDFTTESIKAEEDAMRELAAFEQEMFEQRLNAASTFFNGWAALAALGADQSTGLAIAFKALAAAEAGVNSYLAYTKALASAPWPWNVAAASGVLAKGLAAQAKIWATDVPKFANGGSFVTSGPQMIMVGDNGTGRERVSIDPLGNTGGTADVGMIHNVIMLDGKPIADYMTKASRDGRMITSARSVK